MGDVGDWMTVSIPSNPQYLCILRGFFGSLLETLDFNDAETNGIVLAVHEACANVIEHCYRGDAGQRIDLTVSVMPESITIEIQDYGGPQDVTAFKPRALDDVRPRGLGTHFIQALMDDVSFSASDTGTLLRMTKRRSTPCKSP
jgi:anti-sigma regulatory factor (Ser/Thr protein kinase)